MGFLFFLLSAVSFFLAGLHVRVEDWILADFGWMFLALGFAFSSTIPAILHRGPAKS